MGNVVNFFWFRRDLRLDDNAGLYHALKSSNPVKCIFIFDTTILAHLPKDDARVSYIHQAILDLDQALRMHGSSLLVAYGKPKEIWQMLITKHNVAEVFVNKDFEPSAIERDRQVEEVLQSQHIPLHQYKDHVIFDGTEVLKDDGLPYTVFTPYKKKWLTVLQSKVHESQSFYLKPYPNSQYFHKFWQGQEQALPSLQALGFIPSSIAAPSKEVQQSIIIKYDQQRDFPAIDGTSKLGIHFRFGTISIRDKARKASMLNATFLSELIWRDFYAQILFHFPHVVNGAFRPAYDRIEWIYNEELFELWKKGMTGYPIVDAGMRQLNATGYMHNRVRMVVASFLTKHLMMDWRLGEAYFAEKLLDFDLASNNGGWQWAAGCGTDAAPYFRIFNPDAQEKRFDKERKYIRHWVPEVDTNEYARPIVDHKYARERCLRTYKTALQ